MTWHVKELVKAGMGERRKEKDVIPKRDTLTRTLKSVLDAEK